MAKKQHGELYTRAQKELELAGIKPEGSAATSSIYHTVLKVVDAIEKGSINEFTKGVIKSIAFILSDGELINDVTNDPAEWEEVKDLGDVFEPSHRNLRNPKVFSRDGGLTWERFDGDGRQQGISKDVRGAQNASTETEETV